MIEEYACMFKKLACVWVPGFAMGDLVWVISLPCAAKTFHPHQSPIPAVLAPANHSIA